MFFRTKEIVDTAELFIEQFAEDADGWCLFPFIFCTIL